MSYYEPPEMPHYPDCEEGRNYYCPRCDILTLGGGLKVGTGARGAGSSYPTRRIAPARN